MGVSEKPPNFFHCARESNLGFIDCEPSLLPLHHRAPEGSEGESHRMLDFVEHNCLNQIQMVNESTRCNYILDLVLVTQENLVDNVSVGEHLLSCDHRLVRLDLRAQIRIAENKILVANFIAVLKE